MNNSRMISLQKPEVREFLEEATILDPRFKRKVSEDAAWTRLKDKTMVNMLIITVVTTNNS